MKNILKTKAVLGLVVAALSLGLVSCGTPGAESGRQLINIKAYQSNECIVTDNKLGSMGDPVSLIHGDQQVKFCCAPCVKKFKANPEKYLATLP